MTDEERKNISVALKEMCGSSGGKYLLKHIDEESKQGWRDFIDLPVDKKTSKTSYDYQAKYKVLENLKDWIDTEIKLGGI